MSYESMFDDLAQKARETSEAHGFVRGNDGEAIALIHSEASELLEAVRHGDPKSEHLDGFSSQEEELADIVIRCLDYSAHRNLRLGKALMAKMAFNDTRPIKHGGKKF